MKSTTPHNTRRSSNGKTLQEYVQQKFNSGAHCIANFLKSTSDKLPIRFRKLVFIFFGLIVASVSLGLIIRPFITPSSIKMNSGTIQMPFSHEFSGSVQDPLMTEKEYEQMKLFLQHLDSAKHPRFVSPQTDNKLPTGMP